MSFDAPIKDSGTRAQFSTGAVRDLSSGKGRMDLLPPAVLVQLTRPSLFKDSFDLPQMTPGALTAQMLLAGFMTDFNPEALLESLRHLLFEIENALGTNPTHFHRHTLDEFSSSIIEVAKHFEKGAIKYEARNWEKGINLSRFWDSAYRHLSQYLRGDTDEPHLVAAAWNVACLYQTGVWIATGILPRDLDDLPHEKKMTIPMTPSPAEETLGEGETLVYETKETLKPGDFVVFDLENTELVYDSVPDRIIEAYQNGFDDGQDHVLDNPAVLVAFSEDLGGYSVESLEEGETLKNVLTILSHTSPSCTNPQQVLVELGRDFSKLQDRLADKEGRLNDIQSFIKVTMAGQIKCAHAADFCAGVRNIIQR